MTIEEPSCFRGRSLVDDNTSCEYLRLSFGTWDMLLASSLCSKPYIVAHQDPQSGSFAPARCGLRAGWMFSKTSYGQEATEKLTWGKVLRGVKVRVKPTQDIAMRGVSLPGW
jgi:hypothetical protein